MAKQSIILKSRIFDVVKHTEKLPNGKMICHDVIKHPGAVVIAPLLSKNKIILIWQYRPAIGKYIYELPAGTLEKGENPKKCAIRELIEETGYKSSNMKFLGDIIPVPGYSSEILVMFKAEKLKFVGIAMEDSEVIETRILSKQQVKVLFKKGKIQDAKTISGLAMIGWI